jgi:lipid-binding SYLF domain-containing protein
MKFLSSLTAAAFVGATVFAATPVFAAADNDTEIVARDLKTEAAETVIAATAAVTRLAERPGFADVAQKAQALVIFPEVVKGGFLISGQVGRGVLVKRRADGTWSAPAFYGLLSAGVGLQAGISVNTIGMFVMNKSALTPFYHGGYDLGADASLTALAFSRALDAETVPDVITFTASKGAFAGVSVKGARFTAAPDRNQAFYGREMTTQQANEIAVASSPEVKALQDALNAL